MSEENSKWVGHERKGYYPQNHPENHQPEITSTPDGYQISTGGYTMPALASEVFFWQQVKDLRKLLSKEKFVKSFFTNNPGITDDPNTRAAIEAYGRWILSVADKAVQGRTNAGKDQNETT